ncbi:RNA polymerase sigma factor [Chitinophaga sp. 22620]|uniref:RNA polymerase sigma factor n=1 Tax=Chitinophaga sp. 22620 TaxID=3453952 RepID=UPI003F8481EB
MSARDIVLPANESTFSEVVHAHSASLFLVAMRITKSRPAAEDIVQEAFLRLWQKREEVVPQNLGGWLYKVVSHLAYKHLKKESRQLEVVNSLVHVKTGYSEGVDDLLISKENDEILNDIFGRLPEQQQVVYRLSREKGMRRGEIAVHLNLSPNTVKVHLSRALHFIREHFVGLFAFCLLFFLHNFIFRNGNTTAAEKDLYYIKQVMSRDFPRKKVISLSSPGCDASAGIYR